jgi:sugar/nucleoside kinase (ribokinase family)
VASCRAPLIENASSKRAFGVTGRLLVVGEALVEVMRPHPGIPLDKPGPFAGPFPSGAPAIAADAAARAGAEVSLIAAVGDDPFGRLLVDRLSADGVDTSGVCVIHDAVTGVAFVAYDEAGGREFVFHVADAAPSRTAPADLGSAPENTAWLHVSGSSLTLSESLAKAVLAAVERVLDAGGRVSFDPNLRAGSAGASAAPLGYDRLMEVASLLVPSERELEALGTDADSVARTGATVCETLGRDGARLHHDGAVTKVAGIPTQEVDPTGAGDAFSGTFLAAYMRSGDPVLAAHEANAVAAAHVSALGPMEGGSSTRGPVQAEHASPGHVEHEPL